MILLITLPQQFMVWRVPTREIGGIQGQPRMTSGLGPRKYSGQQYEDSGKTFIMLITIIHDHIKSSL